ncbi:TetR family transcriptional regulator [Alloalcanivorax mobilis]|uniref:TetR family transcriptional regulator n=1 Tax=Alloalcanivorax mobilis TaxID=2019569 RepID=UPI000B5B1A2B|nr:TetR family transcriptional regulator [Alloalcanivorax mobilis]ASK35676.1 TetR family transcriptional regulator [Alcanivorax sp. N3-2A]|tara:strand:+ start:30868 stop:31476 length:609 start_codon:yes stop_codon:yes gene_type:complete
MRRTKEDAEKTRLKILEAALELFSRNGYTNTTLARIAEQAGYSRGPIYWHFKNKDELFEAVLSFSQQPLGALIDEANAAAHRPLQAIEHFSRHWLRLLVDNRWHRQSFEILLNKTELTANLERTLKRERKLTRSVVATLTALVRQAQAHGLATPHAGADELGLLCYTYLMGITQTWLFSPRLFNLEQEIDFFVERLLVLVKT